MTMIALGEWQNEQEQAICFCILSYCSLLVSYVIDVTNLNRRTTQELGTK